MASKVLYVCICMLGKLFEKVKLVYLLGAHELTKVTYCALACVCSVVPRYRDSTDHICLLLALL